MNINTEQEKVNRGYSRREFIKASALTVGAAGVSFVGGPVPVQAAGKSKGLSLSMAGYKFDRTKALIDGRVKIEGCGIQFQESGIGDINTNLFSGPQTFEVTEIGLHPFMLAYANEGFRDYSLLPIFPLRLFRHKSVFIRTDRNIKKPEDLRGKKIATAGYSSTSLTWIRGILQEEYRIKPEDMQWVVSQKDSSAKDAGKVSKQENIFPKGVPISMGPEGKDESDLLASGEVDACFHAGEPRAYVEKHPKVGRLFPDYRSTERAYFKKTGIFPIMHAVAIKKSLVKKNPWLIEAVFKAYSQSKQMAYDYMAQAAWLKDSLPWFGQEFDETRALMGDNYYSYGIGPNRKTLEALFRYSHQQGLCKRELTIEELFESASIELTESQT
ncbi:ABC transporter substrate-binding protein [Thermodesulfobacteriota bacterium]